MKLSLDISNSLNPKVLRIFDTSYSPTGESLENYMIEILPVQKSNWITFLVMRGFSLAVNSSSLQYKSVSHSDDLRDLPDGIYEIKQSYKPNIHTLIHYYHLRIVSLKRKIASEWDKLVGETCKLSREEYNKNRDSLREIDEFLLAAKWKVEECAEKKQGKELYEWAEKLLEQYTNECSC